MSRIERALVFVASPTRGSAVASSVRRLPDPAPLRAVDLNRGRMEAPAVAADPAQRAEPPVRRSVVAPLAPERYLIRVTVSDAAHANLGRAQGLLRHTIPTGDPAELPLLDRLEL